VVGARTETRWEVFSRKLERVLSTHVEIKNIDPLAGALYKSFGRVFFWKPVAWGLALIVLAGLVSFVSWGVTGQAPTKNTESLPSWLTLILLLFTFLVNVLIHEGAHAIAVKRYGRQVNGGGFGLGFFYVNTNEIWLEKRGPRIVVNLAGPLSNALLGSICALALFAVPDTSSIRHLLFLMSTIAFVLVYLNFNPFIETDGYYALMDWVEMPGLRRKALVWLRNRLFSPTQAQKAKPRERKVYSLFGLITLVYLPLTVVLYLFLVAEITRAALEVVLPLSLATPISLVITTLLGLYTIYNLVRDLLTVSQKIEKDDDELGPRTNRTRRRSVK
jgi:putative peptide zinc metalloprotease protein